MTTHTPHWLTVLNREVIACTRCPRLVVYREQIAREKRRAYRECEYWGKPVPGFGDPEARVLVMGLAPGAHGSNRTGRPFTGDASGKFMFPVLHETGFANQPNATDRNDGLRLKDLYITAAVRCAPPANKPTPQELANCAPFLDREIEGLRKVKVVVALGKIGFDAYLNYLKRRAVAHPFDKLRAGSSAKDAEGWAAHSGGRRIPSNMSPVTGYPMVRCYWRLTILRTRIRRPASSREKCLSRYLSRRQDLPMSSLRRRRADRCTLPH